jgi:hypothetical protein
MSPPSVLRWGHEICDAPMERPSELQAKLDRAEAHVKRGAGHVARQKAFLAGTIGKGGHLGLSVELLATFEATQRLHVSHRDLLRKELVRALLGLKEAEPDRLNRKLRQQRMIDDGFRRRNARLRNEIAEVVNTHPELREIVDVLALRQGMYVPIGVPFLRRVHDNLRERALAVIAVKPELLDSFRELLR